MCPKCNQVFGPASRLEPHKTCPKCNSDYINSKTHNIKCEARKEKAKLKEAVVKLEGKVVELHNNVAKIESKNEQNFESLKKTKMADMRATAKNVKTTVRKKK